MDVFTNILAFGAFFKEREQEEELFVICFSSHVRVNWNSIVKIESETHDGVVYDDHILAISVTYNVKVFDIELIDLNTILSVETLREHFTVLIDIVHNVVGILLLSCRENDDFVGGSQLFQAVDEVRSQSHVNFRAQIVEIESLNELGWDMALELRGNKGLVHIKNK